MVARFGAALHVGGRDAAAMAAVAQRYGADPRWRWAQDAATLEDVFIDLMTRNRSGR
jgi:ABC-2 type transport system ATP-binding protein